MDKKPRNNKDDEKLYIDVNIDSFTASAVSCGFFAFLIMLLKETVWAVGISLWMVILITTLMIRTRASDEVVKEGKMGMYGVLALVHILLGVAIVASYIMGFGLVSTAIGAGTGIVWAVIFVICHVIVSKRDAIINEELKK